MITHTLSNLVVILLLFAANPNSITHPVLANQAVHATVQINGVKVGGFVEVSGLGSDANVSEYREGGNLSVTKVTGVSKLSDITLKRGVVPDSSLYDWYKSKTTKTLTLRVIQPNNSAINVLFRGCNPTSYIGPKVLRPPSPPAPSPLPTRAPPPPEPEQLIIHCESATRIP
jgi:phage tail-like protein